MAGACLLAGQPASAQDAGVTLSNRAAQPGVRTSSFSARPLDPPVAPNALLGPAVQPAIDRGTYFTRNRNVAVTERPHPELAPIGLRIGPFLAVPAASVLIDYNDNVFASGLNKQNDGIAVGEVQVEAASDLPRHQLGLLARVRRNEFFTYDTESFTSLLGRVQGRLDVQHNIRIFGTAGYSRAVEPRAASGAAQSVARPIRFSTGNGEISAVTEFTRIRLRGTVAYNRDRYQDGENPAGEVVTQGFRNLNRLRTTGRVEYALSPDKSVFVEGTYDRRRYPSFESEARDRTSDGYELTLGTDFDISAVLRGVVQAGYLGLNFRNPLFSDVSGPGVRGRVEYFLSGLTTITATVTRSIQDAGLQESSGYIDLGGSLRVDHELYRNVLVHVSAGYDNNRFRGIDRVDNRFGADAGFEYRLDRQWAVKGTYNLIVQRSRGEQAGNRFSVGDVTLGLARRF